jgi:dTDP-D-glucose 4,6-dehydratase
MTVCEGYQRQTDFNYRGPGFIGSNIAQQLVIKGANVTIVDSTALLYGGNLANIEEIRNDITLCIGDY